MMPTRAALALVGGVTAPERALIEALPARYPQRDPIDDQRPWNDAFADAMRLVHRAHPDDLDLRTIFAEAILNRTPWQMWDPRTGEPAPGAGTLEAREVLESAFRDLPGAMDHPGLLHLHVHLMEMSPHPEAALVTGDRLREVSPDMGHLTHMPTHIDIQCGHYRDAMHWNQKAIIADRKFYDRAGPMNFYSGYRVHNYHFAAYGAMFLGQYAPAIAAADELIETMPEAMLRIPSPPMADFFESYVSIRQHVLIRFGKWREIIAQDLPADRDLYCNTVAMMHYAKGVAHAALGDVPAAEAEQALFRAAAKRVPESRLDPQRAVRAVAGHRRGDAGGRDRLSPRRARRGLRPSPRRHRAGGRPALRRALGLDAADPPRARRAAAGAGPRGGGRGGLSRGSRPRRHAAPRADPPGQFVGAARAARLPRAARRDRGGRADPPARGLRRRPRRPAGVGVLLLRQGLLSGSLPPRAPARIPSCSPGSGTKWAPLQGGRLPKTDVRSDLDGPPNGASLIQIALERECRRKYCVGVGKGPPFTTALEKIGGLDRDAGGGSGREVSAGAFCPRRAIKLVPAPPNGWASWRQHGRRLEMRIWPNFM